MSAAADEDTFNGALGWADWIWWSIIGGVGLLLILLLLCCCVCVKRAKRKGRQEAMAAVQARERELQERQQAQMRYAQAQQARFPAQNQGQQQTTFNYSKENKPYVPPPPKVQGPQVAANGYALPPQQYAPQHQQQQQYAQPPPQQYVQQPQKYTQPPPPQQYAQQPQQYAQPPPPQQQNAPVVNYAQAIPSRYKQTTPQQQQQYVQQQQPMPPAPVPAQPLPPRNQEPTAGLMHPKRWYDKAPVNPSTTAAAAGINYDDDGSLHHDAPFMSVTSPKKKTQASSTLPVTTTLRDRIDALREGSVQENHTRISVATDASYQSTPTITRDEGANNTLLGGRRSMVMAGSVLSPSHSLTNGDEGFDSARSDDTFSVHPRTHRGPSFDNSEHEDDVHAASFNSRGSVEF